MSGGRPPDSSAGRENRLVQWVYIGTTSIFTYGSDGLRRSSTSGGTTTNFALDGDSVIRESQNGAVTATYLHGPRGPESRRDPNVLRWYLYDGHGSVVGEVDPSGNVTASRKYDVYGAVRASAGTSTSNHKYCGSLGHPSEDGTGLIYMRARYYEPGIGRFVSEDPGRDGANWYGYAVGDPIDALDADGRSTAAEDKAWFQNYTWMIGALCCLAAMGAMSARGGIVRGMRWCGAAIALFCIALGATSDYHTLCAGLMGAVLAGTGGYRSLIVQALSAASLASGNAIARSAAEIAVWMTA